MIIIICARQRRCGPPFRAGWTLDWTGLDWTASCSRLLLSFPLLSVYLSCGLNLFIFRLFWILLPRLVLDMHYRTYFLFIVVLNAVVLYQRSIWVVRRTLQSWPCWRQIILRLLIVPCSYWSVTLITASRVGFECEYELFIKQTGRNEIYPRWVLPSSCMGMGSIVSSWRLRLRLRASWKKIVTNLNFEPFKCGEDPFN